MLFFLIFCRINFVGKINTIFMRVKTALLCIFSLLSIVVCFCLTPVEAASVAYGRIYPGGFPVALELNLDGAVIDEVGFVRTLAGNATLSNKLHRGDMITEIDGVKVRNCDDVVSKVSEGDGKEMEITLLRNGKEASVTVSPYIEGDSGKYKLGIYIRDSIFGVGTVTYIKENGCFAALGHQIVDSVAGEAPIVGGMVYDCEVLGVIKGKRNEPGELKAALKGEPIGEVFTCAVNGIYGRFYNFKPASDPITMGNRSLVTPGKAFILTSIMGKIDAYEAEIIRAIGQSEALAKGIFIRITDKRLLGYTGGIVQGMSGSPLFMGGKLIGAVTHVLINDPTKGYAIYIDWMQF